MSGSRSCSCPRAPTGPRTTASASARSSSSRGHRVVFAAEASWKGKLEPLGFEEDLVDLAPPPRADEQDAGQFWTDFITETAPEFRKPTIEQLVDLHRAGVRVADRRRDLLRAPAEGDPRPSAARRDRRGQRERLPGAADPRCALGAHHELQPARDEGPGAAADLQRLPDRRRRGVVGRSARNTSVRTARRGSGTTRSSSTPARRRCPTSSSSTSPSVLNLSVYPEIADYPSSRPLGPTWHRLESSVRETEEPFEVPAVAARWRRARSSTSRSARSARPTSS